MHGILRRAAGVKKLLPESFRKHDMFDRIFTLVGVPVATVQVSGWISCTFDFCVCAFFI
jgi:hypothetical protein